MCFLEGVLNTLIKTMSLLRRCRVNPASEHPAFFPALSLHGGLDLDRLTAPGSTLCSDYWGKTLRQRLMHVGGLGRKDKGLELAVDCHLSRIIQVVYLKRWSEIQHEKMMILEKYYLDLYQHQKIWAICGYFLKNVSPSGDDASTMTSYSTRDAQMIQSTCYKLNSLQLRALISQYHYSQIKPTFQAVSAWRRMNAHRNQTCNKLFSKKYVCLIIQCKDRNILI